MNDLTYINSGCSDRDELLELQANPLIQDFANVKIDIYELIKATNPTLLMLIKLAKKIMEAE